MTLPDMTLPNVTLLDVITGPASGEHRLHLCSLAEAMEPDTLCWPIGKMEALQAQLAQVPVENTDLHTQLEAAMAQAAAPLPVPKGRFFMNSPVKFDGDTNMLPSFLVQCRMYMGLPPEDFPMKQVKIYFLFNLLKGGSPQGTSFLHPDSPALANIHGQCSQNPEGIQKSTGEKNCQSLHQKTRSWEFTWYYLKRTLPLQTALHIPCTAQVWDFKFPDELPIYIYSD